MARTVTRAWRRSCNKKSALSGVHQQQELCGAGHRAKIELFTNPAEAVEGSQAVYTDSWTSMGFEAEEKMRRQIFKPYQVNRKLLDEAAPGALFMHCLPAHRGQEVTDEVLDGSTSVVLQQSENRMYVQKAILHALFT